MTQEASSLTQKPLHKASTDTHCEDVLLSAVVLQKTSCIAQCRLIYHLVFFVNNKVLHNQQ